MKLYILHFGQILLTIWHKIYSQWLMMVQMNQEFLRWILCVSISFDCEGNNQVEFKLYSTYWTTSEHFWISETLFDKIHSTLIFDELDWNYVVAIDLNNPNTNIGDKKSLKYCILAKNSEGFIRCRM